MRQYTQLVPHAQGERACSDVVELGYADREKSRQRATLRSGVPIGIKLPRGLVMRGGDYLVGDGDCIQVRAALEAVSTVRVDDALSLCRVAYHLGNRHVWLEIGPSYVRYLSDHVLDRMVEGLGAVVTSERAAFEPEAGAYGVHSHAH